jgi:hypothetical protein
VSDQGWTPPLDPVIRPSDPKHPSKNTAPIRIRSDVFNALQDLELACCTLGAAPKETASDAYAVVAQRRRELYELLRHPMDANHHTTLVK